MKQFFTSLSNAVLFLLCLSFMIFPSCVRADIAEKPIVVVVPSYNNKSWYKKNLGTLFDQNYENYRVIYIDDCSKDNTGNLVEAYIKKRGQEHRVHLIRNSQNCGAMKNLYDAIHTCSDEEIIITYDGDDWFPNNEVLSIINQTYQGGEIWLTYGTYINYPGGEIPGHSKPYSQEVIENNLFRTQTNPSHLRTFYAWLFKKIRMEDFLYEGKFMSMGWDLAMMFPMLEMSGERHKCIDKLTYVYNKTNPISDFRVDPGKQERIDRYIRSLPRYSRLSDPSDTPVLY